MTFRRVGCRRVLRKVNVLLVLMLRTNDAILLLYLVILTNDSPIADAHIFDFHRIHNLLLVYY